MKIGFETIYGRDGEHNTPYMTRLVIGRLRLHIFHRGDADPDAHDHQWDFWTFPLIGYVEEVTVRTTPSPVLVITLADGTQRFAPIDYEVHQNYVRPFRWHYRPATYTHRVMYAAKLPRWYRGRYPGSNADELPGRKIITIVWSSGIKRPWGFLKLRDGRWCWVPWRKYIFGNEKDTPC